MIEERQLAYQLIFKGLLSEDAATRERVKKVLTKQCGLTALQVQEVIAKSSGKIAAGELPSDLSQLELALAEAGADVEIEETNPQQISPRATAIDSNNTDSTSESQPAKPKADFALEFDEESAITTTPFVPPTPAGIAKQQSEQSDLGLSLGFDEDSPQLENALPPQEPSKPPVTTSGMESDSGLSLSLDEITEVVLPPAQPVSDTSTEAIGNPLHELSSSLTDAVDQDSPTMRLSDEEGEVSAANKPVASAAIEQVGLALDAISDVIEEINHSLPVEQMVAPKRAVQAKSTPSRSEKQKAISSKAESGWKASDGAGEEVELALKNVIAQYNVTDDEEEPQAKAKNLHSLREEPTHFVINEGGLDENADLATASKSIFGLPKETVVAVAIGGLILLGANYILFMRNDSSNTEEVSAELKADVDAALSSNRQAKPVAAIEKPFRASGTFPRGGGKVAIDAAGTKDGVTALALAFTMNPSAELTPEEIVVGKKRLPWVENVEFPAFTIEPLEKGTVEARAEGKGTLVYDNEKKRVVAAAVVEAAVDMDEKNLKLLIEIGRNKESIKGDYPAAVLPDGSAAFIFKEQIDIPFDK